MITEPGLYNLDCMVALKEYPDNYFDLAIVDPPYGIGCMSMNYTKSGAVRVRGASKAEKRDYRRFSDWDERPTKEYFSELARVSSRQIIWGGNYFTDYLPPFKGFIVWDKRCDEKMSNDYADCELAYMSGGMGVARVFRFLWNGMLQGDMKNKEGRFHPTQKPVQLYTWIISNYAKPGDKLLDTHAGSGSSLVAAHRMGYDMIGFEIDEEYYKLAKERLDREKAQVTLFDVIGKLP